MFDIIITAYNDHDKVIKTLASIAMQINKDEANVYIVNNGSEKDYKNEIKTFKELNIKELKIKKKTSLGYARNYAMDNSTGDYIIFFNAGEEFYTCYALTAFLGQTDKKYDVINGSYYLYYKSIDDMVLINNPRDYSDIYGKAYKREFLVNQKMRFNYSIDCETDSFQALVNIFAGNQNTIEDIISVIYLKEKDEDEQLNHNIMFLHNRLWFIHELLRRKMSVDLVLNNYIFSYLYIFSEVSPKVDDYRYKKLFKYCKKFENDFSKYEDYITEDFIQTLMIDYFSINDVQAKYMINDFNNFRKNFYEKDV